MQNLWIFTILQIITNISSAMSTENMVLAAIRKTAMCHIMTNGSFVISDITKDTGYSATTAAKYISHLVDTGILSEIEKSQSHIKGRKSVRYGITAKDHYFLGIDISAFELTLGLMDMTGKMTHVKRYKDICLTNSYETLDLIQECIKLFIGEIDGIDFSMILGANMNLPGRVNSHKGTSASIFNFEETATSPLAEVLTSRFGMPVYVENDTKAMTYGEYMSKLNHSYKNICFVNVDWGLGMGMIIEGKLYYGKNGYSGEFGHVTTYNNNILCHCGKKGCIETEVSGRAIARKLTERIIQGETSILSSKVYAKSEITTTDLLKAVKAEDALCIELMSTAGMELGRQLSGIMNIFSPDAIIIGGALSGIESYYFLQYVRLAIRQYSLKLICHDVPVIASELGDDAAITGACMIARSKILFGEIQ